MTPETVELLNEVRDAEDPTVEDQERVLAAVRASVTVGAAVGAGVGVSKLAKLLAALGTPGAKLGGIGIGVVVAAGATAVALQQPPSKSTAAAVGAPVVAAPHDLPVAPAPSPSAVGAVEPEPKPEPEPPPTRAPLGARRHEPTSLRTELELLAEVQADIRNGRGAEALKRLDDHDTRDTTLLAEREAARVLALCAAGERAAARAAAAEFLRDHPTSAQRAAVQRACAPDDTP